MGFRALVSDYIPLFYMDTITTSCPDLDAVLANLC